MVFSGGQIEELQIAVRFFPRVGTGNAVKAADEPEILGAGELFIKIWVIGNVTGEVFKVEKIFLHVQFLSLF